MDTVRNNTIKRKVTIAPNLKRIKEMLNANGDVIDPVTKEVIKKAQKDE